mmetsp:Transcript_1163/g.1640  ORF Transcript_1163/g.1640 Transcript_1163/m.1640 type:complete len:240 (+) Transcript_1163:63-782(+)
MKQLSINFVLLFAFLSIQHLPFVLGSCLAEGDAVSAVAQGDSNYICLRINPSNWNTTESYQQIPFQVEVDKFSRIQLTDSWQSITQADDSLYSTVGSDEIAFSIGYQDSFSFQKNFRRSSLTFPLFQIIFIMNKGEVEGVVWDDGCLYCSSSSCAENTYDFAGNLYTTDNNGGKDCFIQDAECVDDSGGVSELCQLTIYVGWSGTDKHGRNLRSAEKRLSQFRSYSLSSYIDKAKSSFS